VTRFTSGDARDELVAIRDLVAPGIVLDGEPCKFCGWPYVRRSGYHCPLCGGKPVRVMNMLRAIDEILHPRGVGLGEADDRRRVAAIKGAS